MNIRNIILLGSLVTMLVTSIYAQESATQCEPSLKTALGDSFLIGVAINQWQLADTNSPAIKQVLRHFNSIVAENCMKCAFIHPQENRYNFTDADRLVEFGEKNGMAVIGHCLIWHSQLPHWFCLDKEGKLVSPETLKTRMKAHIQTIVGRYKGRIKGWDVVNEAIESDGSWRKSPFYQILGEEFIPLAFQYANEADPNVELYYNDYDMYSTKKQAKVLELIHLLKERKIRIDAVGMQGHLEMNYPGLTEFEQSILAYGAAGVNVMITEWDMSALPMAHLGANISDTVEYQAKLNPYTNGLPDSVSKAWNARVLAFMDMFKRHSDTITRVTTWGLSDKNSWKNNFPVRGRTDYPLLFDRNYNPKPVVQKIINQKKSPDQVHNATP